MPSLLAAFRYRKTRPIDAIGARQYQGTNLTRAGKRVKRRKGLAFDHARYQPSTVNDASVIIAPIAGCVLGDVVVWLLVGGKIHHVADRNQGEFRHLETTGTEQEIDPALTVETAPRELHASEMV